MRRRVVVTGMGVVAPNARSVDDFLEALLAGRSGVGRVGVFDASHLPTKIAGEVKGPLESPLPDRKIAFALDAARQAYAQASIGAAPLPPGGGVVLGIGLELFAMPDLVARRRPGFTLPASLAERLRFMQTPSDLCVHLLAERYGLDAPPCVHVSACAAGTDALGHALHLVASGRRAWAMCGGTDSMINPLGMAGFATLQATSTKNDAPERASRPFDRRRDGFVMGEGAGVLVLEPLEHALARGAEILAEVCGYGRSFDAHGISEPHPEGEGAALAMTRALADAGLRPEDVDAVNAHGTATPKNDPVETRALKRVLGARAKDVPVSATKSMIGHLISAAGAVEAIAAIACMNAGMVHPTINLDEPDPECDLDYVPHVARRHPQRRVLSASYGFGGHNAAIVLASAEEARRGA